LTPEGGALSELPGTTIVRQWLGTIDAERFLNVTVPGPMGTTILRICTAKPPDTALHSRHHRAGAGGNYDWADHTENGRIRLCIDAGARRTLNERGRPLGRLLRPERPLPNSPGSLREEPDLPSAILIFPFHPRHRSSHRPRRDDARMQAGLSFRASGSESRNPWPAG